MSSAVIRDRCYELEIRSKKTKENDIFYFKVFQSIPQSSRHIHPLILRPEALLGAKDCHSQCLGNVCIVIGMHQKEEWIWISLTASRLEVDNSKYATVPHYVLPPWKFVGRLQAFSWSHSSIILRSLMNEIKTFGIPATTIIEIKHKELWDNLTFFSLVIWKYCFFSHIRNHYMTIIWPAIIWPRTAILKPLSFTTNFVIMGFGPATRHYGAWYRSCHWPHHVTSCKAFSNIRGLPVGLPFDEPQVQLDLEAAGRPRCNAANWFFPAVVLRA